MEEKKQLYKSFLEKFPIEKLGEMTLEEYSNLNKDDSFCYWLESTTAELGSIWGGSAYKFGIFRFDKEPKENKGQYAHDEQYSWQARLGHTSDEAFQRVRNDIVNIAHFASQSNWEEIEKIKGVWPVVVWKIAYLYSNEQLPPFFNKKDWLIPIAKHLGMTNAASSTRAKIYSFLIDKRGDKDIYQFNEELLDVIREQGQSEGQRVWVYAPGEGAKLWNDCVINNWMRLGWDEIKDITAFTSRKEISSRLQSIHARPEASFMNDSLALWEFAHVMKDGDVVYAKKGTNKIIGRGVVQGDYFFDETLSTFRHIRRINWTHIGEWEYKGLALKTLTDISKYPDFVKKLAELVVNETTPKQSESPERQYWWLVASPKVWTFSEINVGDTQEFTLLNDNGHKRNVYQNFLDAKKGDMVICYTSTPTLQITALGEINKDTDDKNLYFRKTEHLVNTIDYATVRDTVELQNMEFMTGGGRGTLFKLNVDEYEILMEIIRKENPIVSAETMQSYSDKDFLDEVFMHETELKRLKSLLRMKKNIILQGAPGVGKTFTAERLAYTLMGVKDENRIGKVQFHQNYSYEDFVMGYKPNGTGGFDLRDGTFYKFCKKAQNSPNEDFFFIIDEINRGNLSKIFGELLMLIENSYRGDKHAIKLAYKDDVFAVPENLYIIGMMNTADRSLAMIDYALRRRFSFFDMKPGFTTEGFKAYQNKFSSETLNKIVAGIISLNETIKNDNSLGEGFCIGHSYFCNQNEYSDGWMENIIEYDIEPMLREYWFDDKDKYNTQINLLRELLK